MYNSRGPIDTRFALTGKDGMLFDEYGILLATVETYQAQVNVTNAKYQPLGDTQEHEVFQSYSVTLNFTEVVVQDTAFITGMYTGFKVGQMPDWTFQGVLKGRNGSEERIIYRYCVPSGTIDLQNVSIGDLVKRQWSLFVNEPPEMQNLLTINR